VLRGSEADRKLDIFLSSASALPEGKHDWSNVLVIGEHKSNLNEDRSLKTLVQLAGYAREVCGSQPDRRFMGEFSVPQCPVLFLGESSRYRSAQFYSWVRVRGTAVPSPILG
jgi:hypothetical protein